MILAELELYLSRPIAPTRRVALGSSNLPVDPAPGFGGVLLGGVVARYARFLDDEMFEEVGWLAAELCGGRRIPQPRLRHRFQVDRIGLQRARHRLLGAGEKVRFVFDDERGTPAQHVLCAIYAAGAMNDTARPAVFETIGRGLRWRGLVDDRLVAELTGRGRVSGVSVVGDPIRWALDVLSIRHPERHGSVPERHVIQRAFRDGLRDAHPDHGGDDDVAAERIEHLRTARRILLS